MFLSSTSTPSNMLPMVEPNATSTQDGARLNATDADGTNFQNKTSFNPHRLFDYTLENDHELDTSTSLLIKCIDSNQKHFSLSGWWSALENSPLPLSDKAKILHRVRTHAFESPSESRAIATMMGMAVGDALGHTLEFFPVRYDTPKADRKIQSMMGGGKFCLQPGQWTDDCSMGLCLADSLLIKDGDTVDPFDLMLRFEAWWHFGYNNAFGADTARNSKHSVGLGGNISHALQSFLMTGYAATSAGNKQTSGNGSIMRLAAVPIKYCREPTLACAAARTQSVVTHQGEEAAECARLLAFICCAGIQQGSDSGEPQEKEEREEKKEGALGRGSTSETNGNSTGTNKGIAQDVLDSIGRSFVTSEPSVACLALGKAEKGNNPDRQWTWRDPRYKYAPTRARNQPGYVGSYAMDGLGMALHCVYSTFTFEEAVLKCVNMAGDADTVGAITGQIAGSIYGYENIPMEWIESVQQWDNGGDLAFKAHMLYHMRQTEVYL